MRIEINFSGIIALKIWENNQILRDTQFYVVADRRKRKAIWRRAVKFGAELSFDEFENYYTHGGTYIYERSE